ncbi:MAG: hypothetical protein ACI83W_001767 [Marinoscillum sp.]
MKNSFNDVKEVEVPFGKILNNGVYLNAWGSHSERLIGEIKGDAEASVEYFIARFHDLKLKIETLEQEMEESTNKGSFLMKIIHLKESLPSHDGLGDYSALQEKLNSQEHELLQLVEQNRERNSEIKTALLADIREAADKINWKEATAEIHEIKAKWIKTGSPKPEDVEELESEFWGVIDKFFEKKKEFYEDKKRLGEKRIQAYKDLVIKSQKVAKLSGNAREELTESLKFEWEEIGNIQKDDYSPLLREFTNNLKAKTEISTHSAFNVTDIINTLEAYKSGKVNFGYKQLEALKQKMKGFQIVSQHDKKTKNEIFLSIQILLEKDFIDKLAMKRFNNFREIEKDKKRKIRLGIISELIQRDEDDLQMYQENSAKFSASKSGTLDLIEKKLAQQNSKIHVKKLLRDMISLESN